MVEDLQLMEELSFLKPLVKHEVINKIVVYGSRARGDNRVKSDVDIAIDCPQATAQQWDDIKTTVEQLPTLLLIDCVRLDKLNNDLLLQQINKEGKIVFSNE